MPVRCPDLSPLFPAMDTKTRARFFIQVLSFQILAHSFAFPKSSTLFFSNNSELFCKNTRGVGVPSPTLHINAIPANDHPPKSLPHNLFADPHLLNLYATIFYKNSRGRRAYLGFQPSSVPVCLDPKSRECNTSEPRRKCCKQKTYVSAKPFRCNTYKKPGGTSFRPDVSLNPRPAANALPQVRL